MMVSCMYDPAFYYTSDEMALKGVQIDVPSTVEQPEIHILARSASSYLEQATFSQCRLSSIQGLNEVTVSPKGKLITDILPFFH